MRGATICCRIKRAAFRYFNPRAPCGARLCARGFGRGHCNFNPRAPCGARREQQRRSRAEKQYFNPRAPCGARRLECKTPISSMNFNPRAPCGARPITVVITSPDRTFQSTRPMRGATTKPEYQYAIIENFNPRAPCGARPTARGTICGRGYFNPRAPCGARLPVPLPVLAGLEISIHAPHAGRDSKSIQNYFTHFCDKRQFLDNFTQNTAFQSVLPLADRQKLLYLRCEPLRKFLRAFASHYKIIGSSGR